MHKTEHELETRDELIKYFSRYLTTSLKKINPAFQSQRVETDDPYNTAVSLLKKKKKLPLILWQHKNYTDSYNMDYYVLFSKTTGMNYLNVVLSSCIEMLKKQCGKIVVENTNLIMDSRGKTLLTINFVDHDKMPFVHVRLNLNECTNAFIREELLQ